MRKLLVLLGVSTCLQGCASMGPQVSQFSVEYGTAMEQFSNQQIIENILRAKDEKPLHFAELGQITGSLEQQYQIGGTLPFGKYARGSKNSDSLQPQLTFASSPTFTTSPLDTEAFTVGTLQPIDATYFVDLWRAADPNMKKMLLYLFVDSVGNPNQPEMLALANVSQKYVTEPATLGLLRNDFSLPNKSTTSATSKTEGGFDKFSLYVDLLVDNDINFRLVTVLVPVGDPFCISENSTDGVTLKDLTGIADEKTYHLKKVDDSDDCPANDEKTPSKKDESSSSQETIIKLTNSTLIAPNQSAKSNSKRRGGNPRYQLYRILSDQPALCYKDLSAENVKEPKDEQHNNQKQQSSHSTQPNDDGSRKGNHLNLYVETLSLRLSRTPSHLGARSVASSHGGQSTQSLSPGIEESSPYMPLVGMIQDDDCLKAYIFSENENKLSTNKNKYSANKSDSTDLHPIQIHLRSLRGAINYLGTVLRLNDALIAEANKRGIKDDNEDPAYPLPKDINEIKSFYDSVCNDQLKYEGNHDQCTSLIKTLHDAVLVHFKIHQKVSSGPDTNAAIVASYDGTKYTVSKPSATLTGCVDCTSQLIAVLSELVNTNKLSSDIATTKEVQVVP